jgi:hypothetical protein
MRKKAGTPHGVASLSTGAVSPVMAAGSALWERAASSPMKWNREPVIAPTA